MRRWTLAPNFGKAEMVPDPDGEYVALSDVEKVVEELVDRAETLKPGSEENFGRERAYLNSAALLRKALGTGEEK